MSSRSNHSPGATTHSLLMLISNPRGLNSMWYPQTQHSTSLCSKKRHSIECAQKGSAPYHTGDLTFKSKSCTHCTITVMTRQKLQGTWYIGVYAGATGGEFELKMKLLEACPNDCFDNGVCVQRKIQVWWCLSGYTRIDCREALKRKVFAWYPLDGHDADATANKRPLFYKVIADGVLSHKFDVLNLADSYIIILRPTPAIVCSQFTKMAEPELPDLQWGAEQVTNEGSTDQEVVPEVGAWYQWNKLGKSNAIHELSRRVLSTTHEEKWLSCSIFALMSVVCRLARSCLLAILLLL